MRDNISVYKAWAPDNAKWTDWAKPVLFVRPPKQYDVQLATPEFKWGPQLSAQTMVILDLPGKEGVEEALVLARRGYRPVPLYNGVYEPGSNAMIVKVDDIVKALFKGADELERLNFLPDAPPVFMLDANRMKGKGKRPGKFDNRWSVFPQDMPSASFLLKNGIDKVILRTNERQNDLAHVLRRYQEKGITVYTASATGALKEISVVKPSKFKSLTYRLNVISDLIRNGAGGFGRKIPEPTKSGSGGRYYGMG